MPIFCLVTALIYVQLYRKKTKLVIHFCSILFFAQQFVRTRQTIEQTFCKIAETCGFTHIM